MSLSAGVISASELNTEFQAYTTAIDTASALSGKDYQYTLDVVSMATGTNVGLTRVDFIAPDDLELRGLELSVINPDATTRTITITLTAIALDADGTEATVSDYVLGQTISLAVTVASATTSTSLTDYTSGTATRYMLVRGVTYRLAMTSSAASAVTRATGSMVVRARRRRA